MSMFVAIVAGAALGQTVGIDDVWQSGLKDASFRMKVDKASQKELQKINKDFAMSYRFDYTDVDMKEPFMLRLESVVDQERLLYIVNGPTRLIKIPRAKINKREDLSKSPGKRQTIFDFGIIAPSIFNNYMQAKFVRVDRATSDAVFDVTYVPALKDGTRHRIWVDREKKVVTKREWYNQKGGFLQATFNYSKPQKFGTLWMNTRMDVYNADGKFAGGTDFVGMKVNQNLAATMFAVK